jgi:hypothetical protein
MGNSTVQTGHQISVVLDGATDWDITTAPGMFGHLARGLKIKAIGIYAAATEITVTIRNNKLANGTGAVLSKHVTNATGPFSYYQSFEGGIWAWPAMDSAGDCVGAAIVTFFIDNP